jgi:hypothetical protein
MKAGTILTMLIALMLVAAIPAVAVAGDKREAPMEDRTSGDVVGSVHVNATANSASVRVHTSDLNPGHAYTIWSFSFSYPGECSGSCGPDDTSNEDVGFVVQQVAGHPVGKNGKGSFGGSIPVQNASGAEYHIVVADHGLKDPALLPGQIKSGGPNQPQIGVIN